MSLSSLRSLPFFSDFSEEELKTLEPGKEIEFQSGELVIRPGQHDAFFVLIEGEVNVVFKTGPHETMLYNFKSGDYFGQVPILLEWSDHYCEASAIKPSKVIKWEKDAFLRMMHSNPSMTRALLRSMAQRFQILESTISQNEKLIALGRLSAGLAHELNNPGSAMARSAAQMRDILPELLRITYELIQQCSVAPEQFQSLLKFKQESLTRLNQSKGSLTDDPLLRVDKEEEMTKWLETHSIQNSGKLASTFALAQIDKVMLDDLLAKAPKCSANDALNWLDLVITSEMLLQDMSISTQRITELIRSVQAYSHMDQAPIQNVDVHEGLDNTLTILRHKLKEKGISVKCEYDRDIPRISAFGSELNQVWTNIIDNAIDALDKGGNIWIRTGKEEGNHILVEIEDNGPGIPSEIQGRIFEPFFTTKPVGKGTGQGMNITHGIVVGKHKGDIKISSKPGSTRFIVRLPLSSA